MKKLSGCSGFDGCGEFRFAVSDSPIGIGESPGAGGFPEWVTM